jgi:hypothetical protein
VQMDSSLRRRPVEQVVLDLIGDDGGPLRSHGQSEAEQRSFDATCRKLFRFLTAPEISRGPPVRESPRSMMFGSFTYGTFHLTRPYSSHFPSLPNRLRRPTSPTHSVARLLVAWLSPRFWYYSAVR